MTHPTSRHAGSQQGWALPVIMVLGTVLLLLSATLYFMLNREFKSNYQSISSDKSFQGGDAALNRATTWLQTNWKHIGADYGGAGYDSLTIPAYTDIPGITYYLSITAGELSNTCNCKAYVNPNIWTNIGDLSRDRTIFTRIVNTNGNARQEKYYYNTIHQDSNCRPLFSDPLTSFTSMTFINGEPSGTCYSLTQAASGTTSYFKGLARQIAGTTISNKIADYKDYQGFYQNLTNCPQIIALPGSPCIVPTLSSINDSFTFVAATVPPTDSFCNAIETTCGSAMINGQTDSYTQPSNMTAGTNHGDVKSGSTITKNGSGVINGVPTANSPKAGCPTTPAPKPTPTGLTKFTGISLNVNSGATLTLSPGDYTGLGTINNGGTVYLTGGRYIFDGIQNNAGNSIYCNSATEIWLTSSFNNSGLIKPMSLNPIDLIINFGSSTTINDNSNGILYGFLNAPASTININETIYGGVVGNSVTLNGNAKVYYPWQNGTCWSRTTTTCPGAVSLTPNVLYLYPLASTDSHVFQCKDFNLGSGSIYVDVSNGPVSLYVTGNFTSDITKAPSILTNTKDHPTVFSASIPGQADKFTLYVNGTSVLLSNGGTYNMGLLAPNAQVTFKGSAACTFNGAIYANSIVHDNSVSGGTISFHYPLGMAGNVNSYFDPPIIIKGWRPY